MPSKKKREDMERMTTLVDYVRTFRVMLTHDTAIKLSSMFMADMTPEFLGHDCLASFIMLQKEESAGAARAPWRMHIFQRLHVGSGFEGVQKLRAEAKSRADATLGYNIHVHSRVKRKDLFKPLHLLHREDPNRHTMRKDRVWAMLLAPEDNAQVVKLGQLVGMEMAVKRDAAWDRARDAGVLFDDSQASDEMLFKYLPQFIPQEARNVVIMPVYSMRYMMGYQPDSPMSLHGGARKRSAKRGAKRRAKKKGSAPTWIMQAQIFKRTPARKLRPASRPRWAMLAQSLEHAEGHLTFRSKPFNPKGWMVSEKLDGVRALWDHERRAFYSRGGHLMDKAPAYILENMPQHTSLDGELWMGRGMFPETMSAYRHTDQWHKLQFRVFDSPSATGDTLSRLRIARDVIASSPLSESVPRPFLVMEPQWSIANKTSLLRRFRAIVGKGGEGLMIRDPRAQYAQNKRTSSILKLKPVMDAEAIVTRTHVGGRDAVEAVWDNGPHKGKHFRMSARGHTHELVKGARATVHFKNYTASGKPREPVFHALRGEDNAK